MIAGSIQKKFELFMKKGLRGQAEGDGTEGAERGAGWYV